MEIVKSKIRADKTKSLLKLFIGWPILVFFGAAIAGMLLEYDPSELSAVILSVLFVLLGLWLIISAGIASSLIAKVDHYADLIASEPSGSIERIAFAAGMPADKLRKDVQAIIRKGYYNDVIYNRQRDAVISVRPARSEDLGTPKRAVCRSCGGVTEYYGDSGACAYCDSPLGSADTSAR